MIECICFEELRKNVMSWLFECLKRRESSTPAPKEKGGTFSTNLFFLGKRQKGLLDSAACDATRKVHSVVKVNSAENKCFLHQTFHCRNIKSQEKEWCEETFIKNIMTATEKFDFKHFHSEHFCPTGSKVIQKIFSISKKTKQIIAPCFYLFFDSRPSQHFKMFSRTNQNRILQLKVAADHFLLSSNFILIDFTHLIHPFTPGKFKVSDLLSNFLISGTKWTEFWE